VPAADLTPVHRSVAGSLGDRYDLHVWAVVALQELEQLPSDRPLHTAPDLSGALALSPPADRVGPGCWVVAQPHSRSAPVRLRMASSND
jgi:hypothetical protein